MEYAAILIGLAVIFGLYMTWGVGANDVANAMGTSVGSGASTVRKAIIIAAIFEFSGAFLAGGPVTSTIRKGIIDASVVPSPEILVLGITGGIIPCPGALTAFLVAIQGGVAKGFRGLLAVVSFSAGLALVLVIIGLLMVTSTRFMERAARSKHRLESLLRILPVLSGVAVMVVGGAIAYYALITGPR